jgi:hypothetical protein
VSCQYDDNDLESREGDIEKNGLELIKPETLCARLLSIFTVQSYEGIVGSTNDQRPKGSNSAARNPDE